MKNNTFLLGELFCGPGGLALGAKLAVPQTSKNGQTFSISQSWGVDKDENAIATYNTNNLGEGVISDAISFVESKNDGDVKNLNAFNNISALAFGFPCNDFSLVGEQKGFQGAFGNLYKAGVIAIEKTNPDWFIAENVSGIHSANSGKAFQKILSELNKSGKYGYELTVHLYKFENYGIPQYRHRYIIVGIRKNHRLKFKVPAPTHLNSHITAKQKLSEPCELPLYNNETTKQSKNVVERLNFIPPWENAWYLDKLLKLTKNERTAELSKIPWYNNKIKHMLDEEIVNNIINCKLNCTKARMSHIYKRLHPNKPSYTITGSGGGGTHVYHWEEPRALTNRERARLQGFPDSFVFKGSKEQVRKQIGMAVPPLGAKIIFEAILKLFSGITYPFVEESYKNENYLL
ncbi:MAG: cytosine-specific methyltransferase [Melioribacteraceae bacterium]|nr:MAG: cytosine-specific methyltransferase [Melioribacteraceae bacterium]